ncbi:tripartite tricarboxylate transporter substrate binding protein [Anaerotruncus rubiinfantis]|uniref:tripartite tricarboxylate transporter substrate binding protein n=1 Tax=Anaerotruncus rubiinfantis TaxID=1720200 RepID=UPI0034A4D1C6
MKQIGIRALALAVGAGLLLAGCAENSTSVSSVAPAAEAPAASAPVSTSTDAYPKKAINFIVPFNPGGSSDMLARAIANEGAQYFSQPLTIINKPGGSCAIGFSEVITAKPDGYTIGIANNGVSQLPISMETPYVYYEEMTPICEWGEVPYVCVVNAKSPYQTLDDLAQAIKAEPDKIVSGAAAAASATHWEMEMLGLLVDSDVKTIIFEGGSPAIAALLGGNIDVTVQAPTECIPHIESGDLRCIAVFGTARMQNELFKEVPTAREQGYDIVSELWQGCGGPKDMDPEALSYLEKAMEQALADPKVKKSIESLGFEVKYRDSEGYRQKWEETAEIFRNVFDKLGDRLNVA